VHPTVPVVIIDDNSNPTYVHATHPHTNVLTIVSSEYPPQRGELLPLLYFVRHGHQWFDAAIVIHDSVFFHAPLRIQSLLNSHHVSAMPLWHFPADKQELQPLSKLMRVLPPWVRHQLHSTWQEAQTLNHAFHPQWVGCFGVQCFVRHSWLTRVWKQYQLDALTAAVSCRPDRCALERLWGCILSLEAPTTSTARRSLLGNIFAYQTWGYTFDQYKHDTDPQHHHQVPAPIVKVWTGR
jgi:hypothetical protein